MEILESKRKILTNQNNYKIRNILFEKLPITITTFFCHTYISITIVSPYYLSYERFMLRNEIHAMHLVNFPSLSPKTKHVLSVEKKRKKKNWRTSDVNGIHFSCTPTTFERVHYFIGRGRYFDDPRH